ncbi:unnamed protein product [Moneuplotes crassus]|uniref:Uncharacterized protein n=1 Tax=Euplotes crassus TaxID=5936 RepID=A0AAD1Y9V8_EUPCR|nr:unnamed protein product [Moneuplotes crassus]
MERIDKLTDIYLENLDPIKDEQVDQETLKESLLNILDSIKNRSGNTLKESAIGRINSSKIKKISLWNKKNTDFSKYSDESEIQASITGILPCLLTAFKFPNCYNITDAYQYYCQDKNEINALLLIERRLVSHIVTILSQQLDQIKTEKDDLEYKLTIMDKKCYSLREQCNKLKKEEISLRRHNSKLVFNSFVSDLTEVPRKDARSQARVKEMMRDLSSGSQKEIMYDTTSGKSNNVSKILRRTHKACSQEKYTMNKENSLNDLNQIEVANHFIHKFDRYGTGLKKFKQEMLKEEKPSRDIRIDKGDYYMLPEPKTKDLLSNSCVRQDISSQFVPENDKVRCMSEKKRKIIHTDAKSNQGDEKEELATFLALESETQKEILQEEAFDIEDIKIDNQKENPYFVQNLLNVMNNKRVDISNERQSVERSMEKRITLDSTGIICDTSTSMRMGIASKIANAKHERLDKSPVMKYLSISLVKENQPGSATRKNSQNTIKLNKYDSKKTSRAFSPRSVEKKPKAKPTFGLKKNKSKVEGKSTSRIPQPKAKNKESNVKQGKITLYSSKYTRTKSKPFGMK